jgi:hypothetical protein
MLDLQSLDQQGVQPQTAGTSCKRTSRFRLNDRNDLKAATQYIAGVFLVLSGELTEMIPHSSF